MGLNKLIERLQDGGIAYLVDEPMAQHTTFHIGGAADVYVMPTTISECVDIVAWAREMDLALFVAGNGSNLLVRDGGIRGVVLSTSKMRTVERTARGLRAEAGVSLALLAQKAKAAALTGLEFACGIPGTVGGAIYMNAGAYGGQMSDIVVSATVLTPSGAIVERRCEELAFGYRQSSIKATGDIVLQVELELALGEQEAISERMATYNAQRMAKQPLELPSAGSTFKRPAGNFAGTLIDKSGLKGLRRGGAEVSTKHAGFVVNCGNATAQDVLAVISAVEERVYALHGISLEPEVLIIGEDLV